MESATYVFTLDYIDSITGQPASAEVTDHATARQLARALALASGRRAIITRQRVQLWNIRIVDTQTGEVWQAWTGLTKPDVLARWKRWRERKTECVLVAWPQWLPQATITMSAPDEHRENNSAQSA
ncbi:MAG: hypothetical protein IT422_04865 [Pirellulaceae bacterium]|nr:hypothetical protein [Pirellulaceae bacterium]